MGFPLPIRRGSGELRELPAGPRALKEEFGAFYLSQNPSGGRKI